MSFWTKVFASGGEQSYGRVGSFIVLWFVMGWMTWLVIKVTNFAADLPALALFLSACIGAISALYGISKVGEVKKENSKNDQTPPAV